MVDQQYKGGRGQMDVYTGKVYFLVHITLLWNCKHWSLQLIGLFEVKAKVSQPSNHGFQRIDMYIEHSTCM